MCISSVDSHGADGVNGCSCAADRLARSGVRLSNILQEKKTRYAARQFFFAVLIMHDICQWNSPAGRNTHSCSTPKPNVSCVTHAISSFLVTPRQLQTRAALRLIRPSRCETRAFLSGLLWTGVRKIHFHCTYNLTPWWHTCSLEMMTQLASLVITLTLAENPG